MTDYRPYCTLGDVAAALAAHGVLAAVDGDRSLPIRGAACDSRSVEPGNLFVCKGAAFRPEFLVSALDTGAVAYLCDEAHAAELAAVASGVPRLVARDLRPAMAYASAVAWGHPDRRLSVVGITGTKGKTTATYLLRSMIDALGGEPCGYMGTHDVFDGLAHTSSVNTTPEAPDLWRHLANAVEAGLRYVVMEVSSQALKYDRTLGLHLSVGCFLNIGRDHISPVEHPTFEDYLESKLKLFSQSGVCVVNAETDHRGRVLAAAEQSGCPVVTYGLLPPADVWASDLRPCGTSMEFVAHTPGWSAPLAIPLAGAYNVSNALAGIACLRALGVPSAKAEAACAAGLPAAKVPGRMEVHQTADGLVTVVVDYAHNDMSYLEFFSAADAVWPKVHRTALFGVSGGKALNRYVELPSIASQHADLLILTSDDPGPVDPAELVHEISANVAPGVPFEEEPDREKAVDRAFALACERAAAGERSLVCLLGKGAEDSVLQAGVSVPIEPDTAHAARLVREYDEKREH